jgi:hypothetical protein
MLILNTADILPINYIFLLQRVKRVGYKLYRVINMELQDLIDVEKKQVEIKAFLVHKSVDYCASYDYQKPKYTDLFKEYDRYKFNLKLNQLPGLYCISSLLRNLIVNSVPLALFGSSFPSN